MADAWNPMIPTLINYAKGHCDQACIIGKDGAIWTNDAEPNHLPITQEEAVVIAKAIREEDESTLHNDRLCVAGVKYQFIKRDEDKYYGKKKDGGDMTMQKTKHAILVAHTKEGAQLGETNWGVKEMAEYFEKSGY